MAETGSSEAGRLERLWSSDFGDAYVDRNADVHEARGPFWRDVLSEFPCRRVLEVGCNVGGNLRWMAEAVPAKGIFGVDVNQKALEVLRTRMPDMNAVWSAARDLPFRAASFDLVFTAGVLIHQAEQALPLVMAEMVRCSRRYVLCAEYFSEATVEVPYRGESGALFKRDYGGLLARRFPELSLRRQGFLGRDDGWDDVTYWVFEKG